LWRLLDPEPTLAALDEYEGPQYPRAVVKVAEGAASEAWIYVYSGNVDAGQRIQSGDFLAL
jgi:gamma-glutamylcyclotransferase (GGCT)/AIG2-like uncharacterized protein YtfP